MNYKDNHKLKTWMPTIIFSVLFFALVMNFGSIFDAFNKILVIVSPLLAGMGIALVLNVPLRGMNSLLLRLDKKNRLGEKWRRILSSLLSLILTPLAIIAIIAFFIPQLHDAISSLYNTITNNSDEIEAFISRFLSDDSDFNLSKILDEVKNWFTGNIGTIAGATVNTAMSIFSSVTTGIMSIMFAIYVLLDKKRISHSAKRFMFSFFPRKVAAYISRVGSLFVSTFSTFLSRQCLESVILGGILFLFMTLFKLPYALSICCLTVVMALIPYVGAFLSLGIGALMILLESPTDALIFCALFLVVQQIEGNVIYPRVVGESVGLPAYLTIMAVSLGGAFMGMVGMLLFVPITSVVYTLAKEAMDKRLPEPFDENACIEETLKESES